MGAFHDASFFPTKGSLVRFIRVFFSVWTEFDVFCCRCLFFVVRVLETKVQGGTKDRPDDAFDREEIPRRKAHSEKVSVWSDAAEGNPFPETRGQGDVLWTWAINLCEIDSVDRDEDFEGPARFGGSLDY